MVFGGGGQVGCHLLEMASATGHGLTALTHAEADICDPDAVAAAIAKHAPTSIVNAKEDDKVNPQGSYAASKEAGERAVRSAHDRHLILRTAWVYGPFGTNFLKTMLRLGAEREELRVVNDQTGCPTSTEDLAGAILTLVESIERPGFSGWGTIIMPAPTRSPGMASPP
jgi:dTDP-4-dehydrorhamnose reductase